MARKLRQQIAQVCTAFRLNVQTFFAHAFQTKFGTRRGVLKEARLAAGRFSGTGQLTKRARAAISHFLSSLHGNATAAA